MENKPIAWVVFDSLGDEDDFFFEEPNDLPEGYTYAPLYTAPPKREITDDDFVAEARRRGFFISAPQQREWVGLTDEEMNAAYREAFGLIDSRMVGDQIKFVRAIEAKLREKNKNL